MKKVRYLIATAAALISLSAQAQTWIEVVETPTTSFFMRADMIGIEKDQNKRNLVWAAGIIKTKPQNEQVLVLWAVYLESCISKSGEFMIFDTNGNKKSSVEFSESKKSVAGLLAQVMCSAVLGGRQTTI